MRKNVKKLKTKRKKRSLSNHFKLGKLTISLRKRLNFNGKEWAALKKRCEKRDGGKKCMKANKDCFGAMHLHHKKPLKSGGTNRPANLAWICHVHHCMVHPFMIKLLIKKVEGRR